MTTTMYIHNFSYIWKISFLISIYEKSAFLLKHAEDILCSLATFIFFLFNFFLFFNWRIIVLQNLWFSVIHQEESAIGIPMPPPSKTSLPSPFSLYPSACRRAPVWVSWALQQIPIGCFTHGIVNFYVTLSIHLPFSLLSSHLVHRSVLYICFSIATLKIIHQCHLFRFHIYMSVYDIYILFLTYFTI